MHALFHESFQVYSIIIIIILWKKILWIFSNLYSSLHFLLKQTLLPLLSLAWMTCEINNNSNIDLTNTSHLKYDIAAFDKCLFYNICARGINWAFVIPKTYYFIYFKSIFEGKKGKTKQKLLATMHTKSYMTKMPTDVCLHQRIESVGRWHACLQYMTCTEREIIFIIICRIKLIIWMVGKQ